jgi:hypothetical protein
MPNLLPFRDYSEHEVLNLFACKTIANKGTLVAPVTNPISGSGPLNLSSNAPGAIYPNSVTNNFDLIGTVTPVVNYSGVPTAIGLLLKDVREFDENGKKLVFDSRKAAEMDVVIKDIQAVPILVRGLILVNDIDTTDRGGGGGNPDIGDAAYVGSNGRIGTDGTVVGGTMPKIGRFLSSKDENGYCLVKVDFA